MSCRASDGAERFPRGYLKELARYWSTSARLAEAGGHAEREFPQFTTVTDGQQIHFLHVRSSEADALPLIITHGYPNSVAEFLNVVGPLTDPRAHGGDRSDAFHLGGPVAARLRVLQPEDAVDRHQLLTNVSIYWFSGTGTSAAHFIYKAAHAEREWGAMSQAPTGMAVIAADDMLRYVLNRDEHIEHWSEFDRDGHFPAMEVPDLVATSGSSSATFGDGDVLTARALDRATLARQLLLRRHPVGRGYRATGRHAGPSAQRSLRRAVTYLAPLVQVPPRSLWGRVGRPTWTMVDAWSRHHGGATRS